MKKTGLLITIIIGVLIFNLILSRDKDSVILFKKVDYSINVAFENEQQLVGIAYLKTLEEAHTKYISNFDNIKIYDFFGDQSYLIIPRYDNIEIKVFEVMLNEGKNIKGDLLATTKVPFIIICNEEDTNVILEFSYNDILFEYIPSLNEDDNSVNTNDYLFDMTKE